MQSQNCLAHLLFHSSSVWASSIILVEAVDKQVSTSFPKSVNSLGLTCSSDESLSSIGIGVLHLKLASELDHPGTYKGPRVILICEWRFEILAGQIEYLRCWAHRSRTDLCVESALSALLYWAIQRWLGMHGANSCSGWHVRYWTYKLTQSWRICLTASEEWSLLDMVHKSPQWWATNCPHCRTFRSGHYINVSQIQFDWEFCAHPFCQTQAKSEESKLILACSIFVLLSEHCHSLCRPDLTLRSQRLYVS